MTDSSESSAILRQRLPTDLHDLNLRRTSLIVKPGDLQADFSSALNALTDFSPLYLVYRCQNICETVWRLRRHISGRGCHWRGHCPSLFFQLYDLCWWLFADYCYQEDQIWPKGWKYPAWYFIGTLTLQLNFLVHINDTRLWRRHWRSPSTSGQHSITPIYVAPCRWHRQISRLQQLQCPGLATATSSTSCGNINVSTSYSSCVP